MKKIANKQKKNTFNEITFGEKKKQHHIKKSDNVLLYQIMR